MKRLRPLYRFLIFTNMLIAFAALAQCYLTYIILGEQANLYILLIEGSSTLLLYNFSLYLSKPKNPNRSPYERTRWVFNHMGLFWVCSALALGLMLYSLSQVHPYTWAYLLFVGTVSISYSFPFFKVNGKRTGLRQITGVKLFYIALVWSLSSVGLPVVELWAEGLPIDWWVANYLGLIKILFLLICTLPFDIRDMEQDSYYHLKTIPHIIGERKAILSCYGMIILHTILIVLSPYALAIKWGLIITNALLFLALYFLIFKDLRKYHQVYLLDFALIVQCVVTYAFTVFMS
ncbi:UbiA family prenyltransferase [Sphingobacterium sp. SGG-5]|uniref:UbiA family prenyltransferase n=1 Tax=Sphingobacterium sp. SGG-5 TaxID=2710881 RepID=UPI0013EA6A95|nr:UbiA family prenyltransferase [Sphingobacterium sp. SGG-5]NGM63379.1 UbiA family prenyltransferase [Sphingobacterium sp. SGG-5]